MKVQDVHEELEKFWSKRFELKIPLYDAVVVETDPDSLRMTMDRRITFIMSAVEGLQYDAAVNLIGKHDGETSIPFFHRLCFSLQNIAARATTKDQRDCVQRPPSEPTPPR